MLSTREFYQQIALWAEQKMFSHIKASATKRIAAKGLVDLGDGSYWRYMEPEWIERAIKSNAMRYNSLHQLVPVGQEMFLDEVVGRQGVKEITRPKKKLTFDLFEAFERSYMEYRKTKYAQRLIDVSDFVEKFKQKEGEKE